MVKAISSTSPDVSLTQGPDAPLNEIEVLPSSSGAPVVSFTGYAAEVVKVLGLSEVKVSISHSDEVAIAQAVAR